MAFQFAYTQGGDAGVAIYDFPIDTVANYKTGAGTNDAKKGDLVFISGGLLRKAVSTTGNVTLGVLEGGGFTGLVAAGQPYAATNSSFTAEIIDTAKNPNGIGKVRIDKTAVYKVPVQQTGITTATNAHIGQSYTIALDAAGDQTVDLDVQTTPCVKVIDRTLDGKFVYVTLL
jgi:hypothetical protein